MTPLEQAVQASNMELARLREEVKVATQMWRSAEEREAILKGRIEALDKQLQETKDRSDHNLQWAVEVTKQIHNIGMFAAEAMNLARQEVQAAKGNGKDINQAINAVEKAISDAVQSKEPQRQISDNQIHPGPRS